MANIPGPDPAERITALLSDMIRTWGTVGVMIDGAPILGETPGHPGIFNAVGANGHTMGPILGRTTADLIARGTSDRDLAPFTLDRL